MSQSFDVWAFHAIKSWTNGRHLWLRNNLSTIASQTIDTLLYSFVVWWGIVDLQTAIALGIVKYGFKCSSRPSTRLSSTGHGTGIGPMRAKSKNAIVEASCNGRARPALTRANNR